MLTEHSPYLINRAKNPQALLVFAHGAGANMVHPFMETVATALAEKHITVVRFNFPYMIKRALDGKRRPPDKMPVLLRCFEQHIASCVDYAGQDHQALPIYIGGKSMGGRVAATLLVADDDRSTNKYTDVSTAFAKNVNAIKGIVCIGYPFHPIKKPETLRLAPLLRGTVPTLIIQGERDALGCKAELVSYALPGHCQVIVMTDGDHDLKPRVKSGFNHQAHIQAAINHIQDFIHETR